MTSLNALAVSYVDDFLFLAGQAQYMHMGRRFRGRGAEIDWVDLLIPLAVVASVAGIAWLISRSLKLRAQRNADSPQGLFAELCQAHGLDWTNQQLLRAMANAHRLRSPVTLFVEPERFDFERLGVVFENRRMQVAALRSKLFAESGESGAATS
ncbi:MAG: hypothetical protein H8E66_00900 [Planctomycetes bacterium]|nr:hypothetical protein [Planctomycetota bacterium]